MHRRTGVPAASAHHHLQDMEDCVALSVGGPTPQPVEYLPSVGGFLAEEFAFVGRKRFVASEAQGLVNWPVRESGRQADYRGSPWHGVLDLDVADLGIGYTAEAGELRAR